MNLPVFFLSKLGLTDGLTNCYVPIHASAFFQDDPPWLQKSGWQITGVASIKNSYSINSTISDILRQGVNSLAQW